MKKNGWLSAGFVAVVMALGACGGTEEDVALEQVPTTGIEESQSGETHQQAISCDAAGRCPPSFYCDIAWKCRYNGGHR